MAKKSASQQGKFVQTFRNKNVLHAKIDFIHHELVEGAVNKAARDHWKLNSSWRLFSCVSMTFTKDESVEDRMMREDLEAK